MSRTRKTTDGSIRRRLGRGLESLVSKPVPIDVSTDVPGSPRPPSATASLTGERRHVQLKDASAPRSAAPTQPGGGSGDGEVVALPVGSIVVNARQPRTSMDGAGLESLAQSIRQAGLMQPIVVRPRKAGPASSLGGGTPGSYELIAGERRWRAAQHIGLPTIPAIVRHVDDRSAAELALVENIQREDLNPIDRAEAFERLISEFDITHQELAERVGLDRSTITNFTRLTSLDEFSREMVRTNKLSLGHAKVLLSLTNDKMRSDYAARALRQGWSVRELERQVQALRDAGSPGEGKTQASASQPAHVMDLQRRLSEHLGTKVRIRAGAKKGTGAITIDFYTLDQFDGLMERLGFAASEGVNT